jgi:hypothetical protein
MSVDILDPEVIARDARAIREAVVRSTVRYCMDLARMDVRDGYPPSSVAITPVGRAAYVHGYFHGDRGCCTALR